MHYQLIWQTFRSRWAQYLGAAALFIGGGLAVFVPLLRWLLKTLLAAAHIPFVTGVNAGLILREHTIIFGLLVAISLLTLTLMYLQLAALLRTFAALRRGDKVRLLRVWLGALRDIACMRARGFWLLAAFAVVYAPFAGFVLGTSTLVQVQLPLFLISYLLRVPALAALVAALYSGIAYLSVRLLGALCQTLVAGRRPRAAIRASWRDSRGQTLRLLLKFGGLIIVPWLCVYGWSEIWVQLQTLADGQSWAYAAAIVNLTVLLTGRLLLLAAAVSLLALGVLAVGAEAVPVRAKSNRVHQAFWVVMALGVAAIAGFSAAYLPGARTQRPLLIAHRGLDGTNGVQNTLPALRRTMSEHPDYVELDVHETRDGKFVVLHDEDLRKLAGKSKTPRQLTLAQLRGVTVREDGQHAHLASLDQYLRVAFARKQKVIVELKTTPQDSKDAVQRFIRRYAGTLVAHDSRIHSTDLDALEQVHQSAPRLYTSLVLSYALVTPHASTKAYTFAATTIDDQLVAAVHDQHQAVWAWTVNDEVGMQQMLFAGVDGIITDNLQLLQNVVRAHNSHPAYAARMRFLCNTLSDFRYVNRVE